MRTIILFLMFNLSAVADQGNRQNDRKAAPSESMMPNRQVVYKTIGNVELKLHIFTPEGHASTDTRPAILFFFGGGWTHGTPKHFYQQARGFADHGFVAMSAEYRVKSRQKTSPFECVKDGKSAIRWVRTHATELGVDPGRIVAAGASAGGHVAACTGIINGYEEEGEDLRVSSVPDAMILFNPVVDTTEKGYGVRMVGRDRKTEISPCHHVTKGIPPTLILHGTADSTVPFENAERFARLMNEAGNTCRLVSFEGRGHGFCNGIFFRPENGNEDYNQCMQLSFAFLAELGFAASIDGQAPGSTENGYDLWMRYRPLYDTGYRASCRTALRTIVPAGSSASIAIAANELSRGLTGLLDIECPVTKERTGSGAVLIGTPSASSLIESLIPAEDLAVLGDEGFLIRAVTIDNDPCFVITANNDIGVLYGSFAFLRRIQAGTPLTEVACSEKPRNQYRLLNHWDNIDGSVERGYAGKSLWQWGELPGKIDPRYEDYARANASIGINGAVLNNVNADALMLRTDYLKKVKALADIFRPYGIKVYLTANFAAPLHPSNRLGTTRYGAGKGIGDLSTADPLDPRVQDWWNAKADEIYALIPDFGGFLVKADSEGMPGPKSYQRSHADGANCIARALKPHGGLLIWRAFVYEKGGEDRTKAPYAEFMPLDGMFETNVIVQIKNGPLDFQPREPVSPLFGKMTQTDLALELQITQEYLGHSTHMVYLGPMWEEILRFDTGVASNATVARIIDGTIHRRPVSFIAGVANTGSDANWCGHHMAQANWYAFGRMAWDPDLGAADILDEWIPMTFGLNDDIHATIKPMLMQSHQRYIDYTMPLGLNMLTEKGYHEDPWPSGRRNFHRADSTGLGYDRTTSGSDAVSQYAPKVKAMYNELATCPEELLLWFHHVPWTYRLSSGKTLIQELIDRYDTWDDTANWYADSWNSLKGIIDRGRHAEVARKLAAQKAHAELWRNTCVEYFSNLSGNAESGQAVSDPSF